jgi:mRNA-degrading endonuclease toxin of MazEF toxin-antitoxin module
VDKRRMRDAIGTLPGEKLAQVEAGLRLVMGP